MPAGSMVAVQRDDGEPWIYGTIIEHSADDYIDRLYKDK